MWVIQKLTRMYIPAGLGAREPRMVFASLLNGEPRSPNQPIRSISPQDQGSEYLHSSVFKCIQCIVKHC